MRYGLARNPRTVTATLLLAVAGLLVAGLASAEPLQRLSAEAQLNMPNECQDLQKLIRKQAALQTHDQNALNNCRAHQSSCSQFRTDDLNNAIGLFDEEITSLLMDYYASCTVLDKPTELELCRRRGACRERSSWIQLAPTGPLPPKRWEHKAVYDARSNRMIMFGGKIPSNDYAEDVWVLQHANGLQGTPAWIQLTPGRRDPMGRHDHTAVYDQRNNRMIVFGGHTANGLFGADVWVLRNANGLEVGEIIFGQREVSTGALLRSARAAPSWVQLNPTGRPPAAREWHTAVYDAATNRMVVFGGIPGGNDVWVLRNANGLGESPAWEKLHPMGALPPMRVGHTAIYDAASNRMVVFGGGGGGGLGPLFFNDVWVLEHANGLGGDPAWVQLNPTGTPPSEREDHTAIYNPAKNQMVVFGGWRSAGPDQFYFNDVWILKNANGLGDASEWVQFAPAGTPPSARELATAVYDRASNRMIVFGGSYAPFDPPNCGSGACTNDVWVLTHVP
jgi:Kelch motif protein